MMPGSCQTSGSTLTRRTSSSTESFVMCLAAETEPSERTSASGRTSTVTWGTQITPYSLTSSNAVSSCSRKEVVWSTQPAPLTLLRMKLSSLLQSPDTSSKSRSSMSARKFLHTSSLDLALPAGRSTTVAKALVNLLLSIALLEMFQNGAKRS